MIIQIDDKTRIKGTALCWELQRIRNYNGEKRWEPYKWFSTFRQALDEAVHSEIRTHPARGPLLMHSTPYPPSSGAYRS